VVSVRDWVDRRDAEWSASLRNVSLISELGIEDDTLDRAEKIFSEVLRLNSPEAIAKHHPAFLLVAVTSVGSRSWTGGSFYPNFASHLNVHEEKAKAAADVFYKTLKRYKLPRFTDVGGLSRITPILLHGAVPIPQMSNFLAFLLRMRSIDPSMMGENVVEWIREHSEQMSRYPRAMTQFLQHGGDFAADYVNRVFDLLENHDADLPYVTKEAIRASLSNGVPVKSLPAISRPSIFLAADGAMCLRLPPVIPSNGRSVLWRINLEGNVEEHLLTVPWVKDRRTTEGAAIFLNAPAREVLVARDSNEAILPFVDTQDPLLVFDSNGDLLSRVVPVPAGQVTIAAPEDQEVKFFAGAVKNERYMDPPYGWHGWKFKTVDLNPGQEFGLSLARRRKVVGDIQAALLPGKVHNYVRTEDGRPVFFQLPGIEFPLTANVMKWHIDVRDEVGQSLWEDTVDSAGGTFSFPDSLNSAGNYQVNVRGALGRGITQSLALLPDIEIRSTLSFRKLTRSGGLAPANITVLRNGKIIDELKVTSQEAKTESEHLPGFEIEIPHVVVTQTTASGETRRIRSTIALKTDELRGQIFHVSGYDSALKPRMAFHHNGAHVVINSWRRMRAAAEFRLDGFVDEAQKYASGEIYLDVGELVRLATVRPSRLITSLSRIDNELNFDKAAEGPLEFLFYRKLARWEVPMSCRTDETTLEIPLSLRNAGPLRVLVRPYDEWLPLAPPPYPERGVDVFDVSGTWDHSLEPSDTLLLSQVLAGFRPEITRSSVSPKTIEEAAHLLTDTTLSTSERDLITEIAFSDLEGAQRALLASTIPTEVLTAVAIRCGLADIQGRRNIETSELERSLNRNPIFAVRTLNPESLRDIKVTDLLIEFWGENSRVLIEGGADDQEVGRINQAFFGHGNVDYLYRSLGINPDKLLDDDTRIEAGFLMFKNRSALAQVSSKAMGYINQVRKLVDPLGPDWWSFISKRISQPGPAALPALSIAMALASRLSAMGYHEAGRFSRAHRNVYFELASHAPKMVEIDYVRATLFALGRMKSEEY